MSTVVEEEVEPVRTGKAKRGKEKSASHVHVGPNARAFRTGRAFCAVCDADSIIRLTDGERESLRSSRR